MNTNNPFQPVYFLVSVSEGGLDESEVIGMWPGNEWKMLNGQQSGGGRSSMGSGEKRSGEEMENQSEATSFERSNKGWKIISGSRNDEIGERQQPIVTDSGNAMEGSMEDEFRLGDGETGDGNILWKPVETQEDAWGDDV